MRALVCLAAMAVSSSLAGAALAGVPAQAILVAPAPKTILVHDNRVWTCSELACEGRGQGRGQSVVRECARIARKLGPLAAYSRGGMRLEAAQLAACNAARVR